MPTRIPQTFQGDVCLCSQETLGTGSKLCSHVSLVTGFSMSVLSLGLAEVMPARGILGIQTSQRKKSGDVARRQGCCNVYLLRFLLLYTCLLEIHLVTCINTRTFFIVHIFVIVVKYTHCKIYQFSHLTVYDLVAFHTSTVLCHHDLSLAPECFHPPKRHPIPISSHFPSPHCLPPQATTDPLSVSAGLSALDTP